jgi:phage baseplate assembly protein gpV
MSQKNLLSDTDYTSGKDMRFKSAVWLGKVSKIECTDKQANVRVLMPDRIDHEGTPLNSKPIPVLQVASQAKKSYAIPRLDTNVVVVKLANATSDYLVIGSFYTSKDPPPVSDPKLDYTEWEGGHIQKFDANDDAEIFLTQDFKGGWKATVKKDIDIKTTDGGKASIVSDGDMLIKSASGNVNVESPTGTVTIKQETIELQATTIKLTGHVVVTGNIDESGVHHDNLGYHTSGREADLTQRVALLEKRLTEMQTSLSSFGDKLAMRGET